MISKSDRDWLLELLAIPGPSGQEEAVAEFVKAKLAEVGVRTSQFKTDRAHLRSPLRGNLGNLVLRLPGTLRAPRRLLMAHLDTVPICVGCRPVVRGKTIVSSDASTGLGADNRAGTAVLVLTLSRILSEQIPHPPLTFLWTVQEEIGLQGARLLNRSLLGKPQFAFNWDGGSAGKITIGATGGYRLEIDVEGQASHAGGAPEQGVSAIAAASLAIAKLHRTGWHGLIRKGHQLGTSNVGVIQGGAATNVVCDRVQIRAEARSHDAKFRQQIVREIEQAFEQAAEEVQNVQGDCASVEIRGRLDYDSFCLPTDHAAVLEAERAVAACGIEPELAVANGGLDANWLTAHGIPTVSLGCGQLGQHTVHESLDLEQFELACRIAFELATQTGADTPPSRTRRNASPKKKATTPPSRLTGRRKSTGRQR